MFKGFLLRIQGHLCPAIVAPETKIRDRAFVVSKSVLLSVALSCISCLCYEVHALEAEVISELQ